MEIEETCFLDEGDITVDDLRDSVALKMLYGKRISASNWLRWCLA